MILAVTVAFNIRGKSRIRETCCWGSCAPAGSFATEHSSGKTPDLATLEPAHFFLRAKPDAQQKIEVLRSDADGVALQFASNDSTSIYSLAPEPKLFITSQTTVRNGYEERRQASGEILVDGVALPTQYVVEKTRPSRPNSKTVYSDIVFSRISESEAEAFFNFPIPPTNAAGLSDPALVDY